MKSITFQPSNDKRKVCVIIADLSTGKNKSVFYCSITSVFDIVSSNINEL